MTKTPAPADPTTTYLLGGVPFSPRYKEPYRLGVPPLDVSDMYVSPGSLTTRRIMTSAELLVAGATTRTVALWPR